MAGIGTLCAQTVNHTELLGQAEEDYRLGRFEAAQASLSRTLGALDGNDRQKALRLLALCALAQDEDKQAEQYARQLIEQNNYYTNVDDPIRFQDMVARIKSGLTQKVTTASSVSESIHEAPVPVTIITAEMIENLGNNRNLNQILATYVPGMAEIQSFYSDNIAMHGAYAEEQELILVMENGHRLNMRTTNSCSMGYDLSLSKIDHIEVLRGPASSLYGNVALSAVVNIITKDGADQDGVKVQAGYGSHKTIKAELTAGKRFMDADVLLWASIYKSDGELRACRDSEEYLNQFYIVPDSRFGAIVDAYRDKPSYDLGMTFRYKGLNLYFSRKSGKKVPQYNDFGYYDYHRYRNIDGQKPGYGVTATLLEANYTHQLGPVNLSASIYSDWYKVNYYETEGGENLANELKPDPEDRWYSYGIFSMTSLQEHTMGGNVRASTDYKLGGMSGNLLLGTQYEYCKANDVYSQDGESYDQITRVSKFEDIAGDFDHESSLSFYGQAKHMFSKHFIVNAGARYDIKYRYDGERLKAFSPRLALIYMPSERFSMKLGYSKSFVDMALSYRSTSSFNDEQSYLPQYLTAIQYSVMGRIMPLHLNYELNVFYNKFQNLYRFEYTNFSEMKVMNEGHYENWGIEATASYSYKRLSGGLTLYWCKDIKAESYYYLEDERKVAAVPHFTANLNMAWKAIDTRRHQLKLYGNANFTGKKIFMYNDLELYGQWIEKGDELKPQFVIDLGMKYTYNSWLQLSADCENVTNTTRLITGPAFNMYPQYQRGRTLMGTLAVSF